jgi:hypothetical protein
MAMNTYIGAMTCKQLVHVAVLVAASMLVVACSRDRPSRAEGAVQRVGALPERDLAPFQACARDEDCTWTTNGCCDCGNGGVEIGVARSREAAFKASLACATKNVPCTMMMIEPPCGTGEVRCESSRCVFHSAVQKLP